MCSGDKAGNRSRETKRILKPHGAGKKKTHSGQITKNSNAFPPVFTEQKKRGRRAQGGTGKVSGSCGDERGFFQQWRRKMTNRKRAEARKGEENCLGRMKTMSGVGEKKCGQGKRLKTISGGVGGGQGKTDTPDLWAEKGGPRGKNPGIRPTPISVLSGRDSQASNAKAEVRGEGKVGKTR